MSARRNLNGTELNGRALRVDLTENDKQNPAINAAAGNLPGVQSASGNNASMPQKKQQAVNHPAIPGGLVGASPSMAMMSMGEIHDTMVHLKNAVVQNPNELRELLLANPQLTHAILSGQIMLGMVPPPMMPPPQPPNQAAGGVPIPGMPPPPSMVTRPPIIPPPPIPTNQAQQTPPIIQPPDQIQPPPQPPSVQQRQAQQQQQLQPPQAMPQTLPTHIAQQNQQPPQPPVHPQQPQSMPLPPPQQPQQMAQIPTQRQPQPPQPLQPPQRPPQMAPQPAQSVLDNEQAALLSRVMSMTPLQIEHLPPDQREKVLQLQATVSNQLAAANAGASVHGQPPQRGFR